MTNQETPEGLDLGEEKTGKKKLIIILVVVLVLLLGGGVAAYFLLSGGESEDITAAGENTETSSESETEVEKGPVQYHEMNPVFVVNLPGRPSLLQVGVNVRVTSDEMVEFIKHNDPMIRHHLLNLLQGKDAKSLATTEAKEALQSEMLGEVNRLIKELSGPGEVDALFFTSFVMQ